jgi:hypothetical protein
MEWIVRVPGFACWIGRVLSREKDESTPLFALERYMYTYLHVHRLGSSVMS